jgi:large subunit ribosomal protein L5
MGVGEAARDSKVIKDASNDIAQITGQRPKLAKAKKSVANFKLREGVNIGAFSTVRGTRMWEFFDRVLSLALPRIRDFRGLSDSQFDGRGNYTFGITEQSVFHEIDPNTINKTRGMNITIVTTAKNNEEGKAFLKEFGFPFKES